MSISKGLLTGRYAYKIGYGFFFLVQDEDTQREEIIWQM
jgi:hypothetical protein